MIPTVQDQGNAVGGGGSTAETTNPVEEVQGNSVGNGQPSAETTNPAASSSSKQPQSTSTSSFLDYISTRTKDLARHFSQQVAPGPTDQKSNFFTTFGPRSWILIHWIKSDSSGPLDKTTIFRNFPRFWTQLVIIIALTQILSIDNVWSRQTEQTTCLPLLMPH